MKSNYKKLGKYIREVNVRDTNKKVTLLLGVSIEKIFKPSIANTIGTDMSTYKIVKRNQFAYGPVTSRNGDKISIALLEDYDEAIVSQAYTPFEVIDTNELLPEYLMMWFRRPEFDRYARFMSHGSAREIFGWEEMCDTELPIPHIDKQREIVKEYNTIVNRIKLNEQLNQKLEATAQAIYKQWFVDFEFPDENGKPYKSSGGEMEYCEELEKEIPKGWELIPFGKHIFYQEGPGLREWQWTDSGIKVINVKNILFNGTIDPNNSSRYISLKEFQSKYSHFVIEDNDVVIAGSGNTYGKVGKVLSIDLPLLMNTSVIRFHSLDENLLPNSFMQIFLFSNQMKEQIETSITGSAQPNFGPSHIKQMKLIYPTAKILVQFNSFVKPILDKKDIINKMNKSLEKAKELLLSKMATTLEKYEIH